MDFISYEILQNSFARASSWIVQQVGGLPLQGPLSAQLACLYLTSCDLKNIHTSLFSFKILAKRYRDNLYLFERRDHVSSCVNTLTTSLQQLYSMPLQFEQQDDTIQELDCLVTVRPKQKIRIRLHSRATDLLSRANPHVNRWPDPWSNNCRYTLRSLIPGLVHKSDFWSYCNADQALNIATTLAELGAKDLCTSDLKKRFCALWRNTGCPITKDIIHDCVKLGISISQLQQLRPW